MKFFEYTKIFEIFILIIASSSSVTASSLRCANLFNSYDLPELRIQNRNFTTSRNLFEYQAIFRAEKI